MRKTFRRRIFDLSVLLPLLGVWLPAGAQDGAGSSTVDNSLRTSAPGDITYEYAETLYIGPDAVWSISGTHIIYSKYVWIAPTAVIQQNGIGSIVIASPDENPFYPDMSGPTTIDGNNGNPIGAIVYHQNPNNIILADIDDPGFGTTNPEGALAAALHFGNTFAFDIDGGDILLNGHDLITSGGGSFSGHGAERMIVTGNSIAGHVVRLNDSNSSGTYFPVGIAEGDYTPAYIQGSADYYVSVTDYAASGVTVSAPEKGMDRAWHIYGGPASQLGLQHNSPDTDGSSYVDDEAFITRFQGGATWSTGSPEQIASGVHLNSGATASGIPELGNADGAWVTKTSDATTPLPVTLLRFSVAQEGGLVNLAWATVSEANSKGFEIERSKEGVTWLAIGMEISRAQNGSSEAQLNYQFTDSNPWVGQSYYRLKQIDRDGQYVYSPIRSVFIEGSTGIRLFPNPARAYVRLEGLPAVEATYYVYDLAGRQQYVSNGRSSSVRIPLDTLRSGVYLIQVVGADGNKSTHRFVKAD